MFDKELNIFSAKKEATTKKEVGSYVIKIKLENSAGGFATYTFTINVNDIASSPEEENK